MITHGGRCSPVNSTYVFDLVWTICLARLVMLDGIWFPKSDRDLHQETFSGSVQYKPKCPAGLTTGLTLGQGAQVLICLSAWYFQAQRFQPPFCCLSQGCTALKESFLLASKPFYNLCLFCRAFYAVTGHLGKESAFTLPVMPYRQWEAVIRPLLRCLLSMLSRICFAEWTELRTSLQHNQE